MEKRMSERYGQWLLNNYKVLVIITVTLVMLLSIGIGRLTMSSDFKVFFTDDDPYVVAFKQLEDMFERQDDLTFLVVAKEGDLFTKDHLTAIWQLSENAWQLPYSRRVTSLANYQHTSAVDDDILTESLVESVESLVPLRISIIKQISLSEPLVVNQLVNEAGDASTIRVMFNMPAEMNAPKNVVTAAREYATAIETQFPSLEVHLIGTNILSVVIGEAIEADMKTLVLLSYFIIFGGLIILMRSAMVTLTTFMLVTFTVLTTLGIFGWFGFVLSPSAGFVPSILMTIAVADCVHIYTSYTHGIHDGLNKQDAIRESLRVNISPVVITSLTTIIGMLCLNSSESPPYRDLGNMTAVGVAVACTLSLTLFPAILAWLPVPSKIQKSKPSEIMVHLANFVIRFKTPVLGVMLLILIGAGIGLQRNVLVEDWTTYFDETFPARQALDITSEKMQSLHRLEYAFDSGEQNGIYQVEYLQFLDDFSLWLRAQPEVVHVSSLTDIVKRLNMHVHNDAPQTRVIPDNQLLASQLVLMYELSLPQGMGLESMMNMSKSQAKLTVALRRSNSQGVLIFEERVQAWLNKENRYQANGNGVDMAFAKVNDRNMKGLILGTGLGLIVISIVMIVVLRSVKLGLLSLVPNLAPAILAYGLWGMFVGHIDLALSIVICMSLGIVVDDTVHFMMKYLRARREKGLSAEDSVRYSFSTVGVALVTTTVVLASGFAALGASHYTSTRETGTLMAITIVAALFMDFFLLPVLLILIDKKDIHQNATNKINNTPSSQIALQE